MKPIHRTLFRVLLSALACASVYFIPFDAMGISLSVLELRVMAPVGMAACLWIVGTTPPWTTAVPDSQLCGLTV